jgi:hypothetical protein
MATVIRTASATPKYLMYGNLNQDPEQQVRAVLDAPSRENSIELKWLDPPNFQGLRRCKVMDPFGVYLSCEDRGENRVMADIRNVPGGSESVGHTTFHVERLGSYSTTISPGDTIAIWYRSTREKFKKLYWSAPAAGGGVRCVPAANAGPEQEFVIEDGPVVVEVVTSPLPVIAYSLPRTAAGAVRLASPASSLGATVELDTNADFASVPQHIVVPGGETIAPFEIAFSGHCKTGDGIGRPPCSSEDFVITAAAEFGTASVTRTVHFDGENPFVSVLPSALTVDPGHLEVELKVVVLPDARAAKVKMTVSSGNSELVFERFVVVLAPGEGHVFSAQSNGGQKSACAIVNVEFELDGDINTPTCNKPQFPIQVSLG